MHRAVLLFTFIAVWIYLERAAFKKRSGKKFRQIWVYLEKSSSPDPRWPLLNFATLNVLGFSFWEFLIRWALFPSMQKIGVGVVVGTLGWALVLAIRGWPVGHGNRPVFLGRMDFQKTWLLMVLSSQILLAAYFSILLLPWVYYRSRFLTSTPSLPASA